MTTRLIPIWGDEFVTHIPIIDEQHRHLFALIGEFVNFVDSKKWESLPAVIAGFRDYAVMHFRTEEAIWRQHGVNENEFKAHTKYHAEFLPHIEQFEHAFSHQSERFSELLLDYLSSWLVFHILGDDVRLAKIALGHQHDTPNPHQALSDYFSVIALHNLYSAISAVNSRLHNIAEELDQRVAQRTQELERANDQLNKERLLLLHANDALTQTKLQLVEAEKMAAVGMMAAGVAHEMNNPLSFIKSNIATISDYSYTLLALCELFIENQQHLPVTARTRLQQLLAADDLPQLRSDIPEMVKATQDGITRVSQIVQDLKTFSGHQTKTYSEQDFNQALMATANLVAVEIRKKGQFHINLTPLPPVCCELGRINQLVLNLLMNALYAIEKNGRIELRSGFDKENQRAWCEVEDNGHGIKEDVLPHIFDPFFSTKPVGQGTGLGLAVSWAIAQQHGGQLSVKSTVGVGSVFRLEIPCRSPIETTE